MKLQLTKDKTIDIKMPWEKTAAGGASSRKAASLSDVTGVLLESGDPRGCPAVRLQRRKDGLHLLSAGFVPSPVDALPTSWEESKSQTPWSLPTAFQAPQAALAVLSPDLFIRQTNVDALAANGKAEAASEPVKKKLGVRRSPVSEKKDKVAPAKSSAPAPFVPVSRDGNRFVTAPLAEADFVLQTGLPEYQVLWLSRLLPEGHRPTACSVQTGPAAMLAALHEQPDFVAAGGTTAAVFVTRSSIYFAGYKKGKLLLFRECPDAAGYDVMRELVKSGLGVTDELVDSILEDTLIDPRPALEPLVKPVLQQLQLSLDYLAQRHDVHADKVFLMGLPAGAGYWNSFAQEMLGVSFVSPGVFEGLVLPKAADAMPADLTPAASQVFLIALGAARAALEG
jgi:hypothetical protein